MFSLSHRRLAVQQPWYCDAMTRVAREYCILWKLMWSTAESATIVRMAPVAASEQPAASRRARIYANEDVRFPQTSNDPDEWRVEAREPVDLPFIPDRPPGSKGLGISSNDDPAAIYTTLLSDSFHIMLRETNKHAALRYEKGLIKYKFRPVDEAELLVFLALLLAQGATLKKDYQDHWKDKGVNQTPSYAQLMPLKRFKQILQNLHFVDSEEASLEGWDDKEHPNFDPIHKIKEFLFSGYDRFRQARAPGQELSFDEQMIRFHGRFRFKVVMPKKPIRKGIKLYVLTDAKTGYALSCLIHAGNLGTDSCSETFDKVWTGLSNANIFDQGHHLYTDSYYTSRRLAESLYDRDVYLVGTMKAQMSEGLPPVLSDRYSRFSKTLKRGEAVFLHTNKLTVCNWSDSANVILLSAHPTIIGQWTTCNRKNKTPKEGEPVIQEWPQPLIFQAYNEFMGGVDIQGQLVKNSSRSYRSNIWYMSVAHHLLTAGVTNTYVIMKDGLLPGSNQVLTVKKTREMIVSGLLTQAHLMGRRIPPALLPVDITSSKRNLESGDEGTPRKRLCLEAEDKCEKRHDISLNHLPIRSSRGYCKGHKQARWCTMKCQACNVRLCIDCFSNYHTSTESKFDYPNKASQDKRYKQKRKLEEV